MKYEDRFDSLLQYYCFPDLDWSLAKAQMLQESAANPLAASPVGAKGLFQFMSKTWAEWWDGTPGIQGIGTSPDNPETQIMARCHYMRWLLKQHDDQLDEALAAYNWGTGNVRNALKAHGAEWRTALPSETQDYLRKIKQLTVQFRQTTIAV